MTDGQARSSRPAIRSPRFAAITSGAGVGAAWWWLRRLPGPARRGWVRTNYRDHEVSLLLGPAVGAAAVAGAVLTSSAPRRAAAFAVGTAALVGGYDDRYGDRHAKGLRGHLCAVREGRVTTGMVKLVALVAGGIAANAIRRPPVADTMLGAVLVAGGANLVNLFDLRPGRAAKATLLIALPLSLVGDGAGRAGAAAVAGAAVAALPADLREHAMLGDCGAGALGAALGWSIAQRPSSWGRRGAAAAVVGLTLASEWVSFSAVIDRRPALRAIDRVGRVRPRRTEG